MIMNFDIVNKSLIQLFRRVQIIDVLLKTSYYIAKVVENCVDAFFQTLQIIVNYFRTFFKNHKK